MGNTLNDHNQQSVLEQIAQSYEQIKQIPRGTVLLHRESQTTYLLKEYSFVSEPQFKHKLLNLQQELTRGPREYIVSVVRVESKIFSSFCSTTYKIYAVFEYPQVTLREEILARQKENKTFEEAELWSILQSCSNALIELRPVVSLNPAEIFINPDGHLKVIHDDLVDQSYRALLCDQIYYAPQKLKNFTKIDSDLTLKKEAIFSMGMTLLQAAQLAEIAGCYDFTQGNFDQIKLRDMLQLLTDKYSVDFVQVLQNLLDSNPNRRASLMQVQNMLENYWKSESYESCTPLTDSRTQNHIQKIQEPQSIQKIAQAVQETPAEVPLAQKCPNTFSKSNAIQKQKGRQLQLPQDILTFKIKQPELQQSLTTPKNPITQKEGLYTDPRLLEMIKKDLQQFSKLKNSTVVQTSKYTYMYPNTQNILNSIKNLQSPSHPTTSPRQESNFNYHTNSFENHQNSYFKENNPPVDSARKQDAKLDTKPELPGNEVAVSKFMMKKNREPQLIFTIETYEDGRRYEGMTLNGRKHGQGKLIYQDGAYYQGQFKEDKMNGKGILYYQVGQPAYEGDWQNDQFHGHGVLYNQNPEQLNQMFDFRNFNDVDDFWVKYQGQFILDNKSGKGQLFLSNGETLQGEFLQDYINGDGCFTRQNGEVIEGIWEENVLTSIYQEPEQY